MTNTLTISREQFELGFDYVDGKHIPTVKISLSPCHPDDNSAWEARNMLAERIKVLLAAPAVERQEPVVYRYVHDYEHGNGWQRNATGFCEAEHFEHERKDAWRNITPLYTSPPAPVAVTELASHLEAVIAMFTPLDRTCNRTLVEARACLDKVKEMNR